MKITINVQQHLALFHVTEDTGKWFAVVCKKGPNESSGDE